MFFAQTKKGYPNVSWETPKQKVTLIQQKNWKSCFIEQKDTWYWNVFCQFLDPLWSIQNVKEWKHPNQKNEDVFVFCLFSNALRTLEEVWKGLPSLQDRFSHMPNSPNINDNMRKHLESLSNLNAYLLTKNSVGVSFGRLVLRGPTATRAHPTMLDLIYVTPLPLSPVQFQYNCYFNGRN